MVDLAPQMRPRAGRCVSDDHVRESVVRTDALQIRRDVIPRRKLRPAHRFRLMLKSCRRAACESKFAVYSLAAAWNKESKRPLGENTGKTGDELFMGQERHDRAREGA